ncbi:MAG: hypothetical protein AB7P03_29885 [Kofleriaceae bacterium]
MLSHAERTLLDRGEISPGQIAGGALASAVLGFGIGQGIEGRWRDSGWIFTIGEGASVLAILVGVSNQQTECEPDEPSAADCAKDTQRASRIAAAGVIGLLVFRVIGIGDAIVGPTNHNARVRALKARLGQRSVVYAPYFAPVRDGGSVAGLSVSF